jgi:hypothetical protein
MKSQNGIFGMVHWWVLVHSGHIFFHLSHRGIISRAKFPSYQNKTFSAKGQSFVWVYVGLGWEQNEVDGKLMRTVRT